VYTSYYGSRNSIAAFTLRFLLPSFPAYILGGTWFLAWLCGGAECGRAVDAIAGEEGSGGGVASSAPDKSGRGGVGPSDVRRRLSLGCMSAMALICVQVVWPGCEIGSQLREPARFKRAFAEATGILRERVPAGAVVIAHPQFLQHLDYVGRWRLVDAEMLNPSARYRDSRDVDDGTPGGHQAGAFKTRLARYAGLPPLEYCRAVAGDIQEWAGDKPVYRVAGAWELEFRQPPGFGWRSFRDLGRFTLSHGKPIHPDFMAVLRKRGRGVQVDQQDERRMEQAGRQLCLGDEMYLGLWRREGQ
jgi:hypothetical protein